MKNVQISYDLFIKLLQYYHFEKYEYEEEIKQELEKKLNAMVMREHYTNYIQIKKEYILILDGDKIPLLTDKTGA